MHHFVTFLALCLSLGTASNIAMAAPLNPQSERLAYNLKVGGLHVADFLAEFDENETGYPRPFLGNLTGLGPRSKSHPL